MYYVYLDGETLHVPFSDDAIYDATITCDVNASAYFDFTISSTHSMADEIRERASMVTVYSDKELVFEGYVYQVDDNIDGERSISCRSVLSFLSDTVVRPYSTTAGEYSLTAPNTPGEYFNWLINQHNRNCLDAEKIFRIGVNEGSLLVDETGSGTISRSNGDMPTTAEEIEDKILNKLGGYLTLSYDWRGQKEVNLYCNTPGINSQLIDFGVNITDFSKSIDTTDQFTAIRPAGATQDDSDSDEGITIEALEDGDIDDDLIKLGDVIYSRSAVEQYGYIEAGWDDSDAEKAKNLEKTAANELRKNMHPTTTIEVKAVDLSLYMDGYTHLLPGQLVRVRALPFDIDEYLVCNSIDIDINNPENTTFTLGIAYDTLTGQQLDYVAELNASIDSQADRIAGLDDDVKAAALAAAQAAEEAAAAYALAQKIDLTGTYVHIKYSKYEDGLIPGLGTWAEARSVYKLWSEAKNHTWSEVGSAMVDLPTSETEYIGILTDENEDASTNPFDYTWALIKGEDGIQGKDGEDGLSSYLHIKYSDWPDGFDEDGNPAIKETAGAYIGTYVDTEPEDPEDPTYYTWVRIQGIDGADGTSVSILGSYDSLEELEAAHPTGEKGDAYLIDGDLYVWNGSNWENVGKIQGEAGETTYLHIAYANSEDGEVDFSLSDTGDRDYMGTYCDFNEFDSTDPSRYKWIRVRGEDGAGVATIRIYYLASENADGVLNTDDGFTEDMQDLTSEDKYLWSYQVIEYTDGRTETTTAVVVGVYGDTGAAGKDGKDGEDGEDGTTIYGRCTTSASEADKEVTITSGEFSLRNGITISITFTQSNTADNPRLVIASCGTIEIRTNGTPYAYWDSGSTVMFTYDSEYWQVSSTPVYAKEVTVGNGADKHVFIDKDGVSIRQGEYPVAIFEDNKISFSNISGEELGAFQTYTRGDFDYAALMTSGRRNIMLQSLDEETAQDGDILFSAVELAGQGQPSAGAYTPFARMGVGTRDNDLLSYIELREKHSTTLNGIIDMAAEINVYDCALTVGGGFAVLKNTAEDASTFLQANSWLGNSVRLGVGSGGTNRGVYDDTNASWLLYTGSDGTSILNSKNCVVIKPDSAISSSNTGTVFCFNASNTATNQTGTRNQILRGAADSTSVLLQSYASYGRTYSDSPNLHVTSSGTFGRYSSSSARYKKDINYLSNAENASDEGKAKAAVQSLDIGTKPTDPELHYRDRDEADADMHSILDLPVVEFHFEDGYIKAPGYDNSEWVVGLIAEDVEKISPDLAEYQYAEDENGDEVLTDTVESWNVNRLVPKMLYIIQEQADQIADLQERVAEMETKIEATSNAD